MSTDYTVVMATKNGVKFIAETLRSVAAQSLKPAQLILVIDHSTDRTVEEARSVFPNIEVYYSEAHGVVPAMNLGIEKATSPYISFLDDDDLWTPDKQATQIEFLESHPDVDVVCSATRNFSTQLIDGKEVEVSRDFPAARLFTTSSFRRAAFSTYGLIDESLGHFQWIYHWWSQAAEKGLVYKTMDEVHLLRRIHETNSWVSNREEAHRQLLQAVRHHKNRAT